MRQAGRYLPEYQKLKTKYSLDEMFSTPELIRQITILPVELLGVDAAILFADILHVIKMLGASAHFKPEGGISVTPILCGNQDLQKLHRKSPYETLFFVEEGITLLKKELRVPLIGFCGGPFTVASYMIESEKKGELSQTKKWLYSDPESFHHLLQMITEASIDYLKMQIKAGVNAIQIFDSWAGVLPKEEFTIFILPYLKQLIDALKDSNIPILIFCRGSSLFASELVSLKPSGISFDWSYPMHEIRKGVPKTIAVQGNLDPEILNSSFILIKKKTVELLKSMEGDTGFIANLGHGVLPYIPFENVRCFVDTVKAFQG